MADKHSLNYDVRELKLGASFTNNKASQYHTIKYDFKPASVDVNKMATVDVGTNNQVTVTVPHLDGAGVPHTVFKGSQRPYTKECVLIIDRVTGEITLEKLSSNIQVKKTRQESAQKARPLTPVTSELTNTTQRSTSRTRVATNKRGTSHTSALAAGPGAPQAASSAPRYGSGAVQKTPPNMVRSPPRQKTSPPQAPGWSAGGNSTLASLPMIGFDEAPAPAPPPPPHNGYTPAPPAPPRAPERREPERREQERREQERREEKVYQERMPPVDRSQPMMRSDLGNSVTHGVADQSSSSSSSDSGSDSGSDSDSDDNDAPAPPPTVPNGAAPLPTDVLNDDLCLSESGSDSD
ncbi:ell-associated factor Eaf [Plutella xylostella]|uniref:ell-associated factor Eaf n=1 Tax=Plutella xylostella TaxID=51655 RepID=UPI0020323CEC|nr:ell-associated factor Eaf [Plutella xylostella]